MTTPTPLIGTLIRTTTPAPPKLILYGQPGVGKTTFAATANAVLLDCENGAGAIEGLLRTPYLESWPEMRSWLKEISELTAADTPPAIAVDTLDWMISRIAEHVVHDLDPKANTNLTNTLGSSHGGYFKAREIVQNIVCRELLPFLNTIAGNGAVIILLAHAANTRSTTPEGFDVRHAAPDLPAWIAPVFIEWADCVLYATSQGGERLMRTEGTNVVLAKNRYGLPPELPLSWAAFAGAMAARKNSPGGTVPAEITTTNKD